MLDWSVYLPSVTKVPLHNHRLCGYGPCLFAIAIRRGGHSRPSSQRSIIARPLMTRPRTVGHSGRGILDQLADELAGELDRVRPRPALSPDAIAIVEVVVIVVVAVERKRVAADVALGDVEPAAADDVLHLLEPGVLHVAPGEGLEGVGVVFRWDVP